MRREAGIREEGRDGGGVEGGEGRVEEGGEEGGGRNLTVGLIVCRRACERGASHQFKNF